MKIFIINTLSVLLLFQSSGPVMDWCCEFPKLDNLIEHYQELSDANDLSFIQFIMDHYGSEKIDDKENHDGELPFQGNHSCCHAHIFISFSQIIYPEYHSFETKSIPNYYCFIDSSGIPFSIFQPPKLV